jgi:Trk K+ transport system NAD-binding subunit
VPQAPVIVVGLDAVGLAIVHRLHARRVPVRALATARELASWGGELGQLGLEVETVGEAWDTALRRVDLAGCSALVLAADDDSANVDACLLVRRFHPELPVVARVSDGTLVRFLQMTVPHVEVYSMGSTTAPVAAELAVQLLTQVRPSRAVASHAHRDDGAPRRTTAVLVWIMAVSLLLTLAAGAYLSASLGLARGRGLGLALTQLLAGTVPGQGGAGPRAVLTAIGLLGRVWLVCGVGVLVDWLLTRRLASVAQSGAIGWAGHVVVCGAGNVGAKVAELLHKRKIRVVVVESHASLRNVQRLRSKGIPVIIGDATVDETLELAGAHRAGAALAMTNSDAVNLHIGLYLTEVRLAVPTAVRLLAPELTAHLADRADLATVSPVAETAGHVCRTVERLRQERLKVHAPPAEPQPRTGRFAGPEFEPEITPFPETRAPVAPETTADAPLPPAAS